MSSTFFDNPVARALNKAAVGLTTVPVVGGIVGRSLVEIRYTGRKSGRSFHTPVNYRLAGDTSPGRVLHVAGAGNCDSATWDKTEGANIQIRMCYRNGPVVTACSNWQTAEA